MSTEHVGLVLTVRQSLFVCFFSNMTFNISNQVAVLSKSTAPFIFFLESRGKLCPVDCSSPVILAMRTYSVFLFGGLQIIKNDQDSQKLMFNCGYKMITSKEYTTDLAGKLRLKLFCMLSCLLYEVKHNENKAFPVCYK